MSSAIGELTALYRRLGPGARRGLWALLAVELVAIAAAERDIQRRPAGRIRGPKLLWRLVATQNLVGPAVYRYLGRR
ncbi:MAG: hypothetical protein ACRDMX_00950 [Solirubrobacteraceae bacterium]